MKLNNILKAIQEEGADKIDSRRGLFKSFGSKVVMASLPLAAGSLFKTAKAQTTNELIESLNVVLRWEQFGHAFYNKVLNEGPVFPLPAARAALEAVLAQKQKHIDYLVATISNAGGTPNVSTVFDITGGKGSGTGPFADALLDYKKMLGVAQLVEDTTVRVQKGQVTRVMTHDGFLSALLGIHSASGRYAAKVRQMRWEFGAVNVRPWIIGNTSQTDNSYIQSHYNGEAITVQSEVDMIGLNAQAALNYDRVTEAFDEPISKELAAEFLDPFIKP